MSYRKNRANPLTGEQQSGTVLEITDSSEPVTRLTLEDGTLVRLKVSIVEIMRLAAPADNGTVAYELKANLPAHFVPPEEQLDD